MVLLSAFSMAYLKESLMAASLDILSVATKDNGMVEMRVDVKGTLTAVQKDLQMVAYLGLH